MDAQLIQSGLRMALAGIELTPIEPRFPNKETLPYTALKRMLSGEHINQKTFGTMNWRLAAYIFSLIELGWPVRKYDIANGSGKPMRAYYLPPECIVWALDKLKNPAASYPGKNGGLSKTCQTQEPFNYHDDTAKNVAYLLAKIIQHSKHLIDDPLEIRDAQSHCISLMVLGTKIETEKSALMVRGM